MRIKKITAYIVAAMLAVLFAGAFAGCAKNSGNVLEVGVRSWIRNTDYAYDVKNLEVGEMVLQDKVPYRNLSFLGRDYSLVYEKTLIYPIGDTVTDVYTDRTTGNSFEMLESGEVYRASFAKENGVKISLPGAEEQQMQAALEPFVKELALPSQFTGWSFELSQIGGLYYAYWREKVGKTPTGNYVSFVLESDGTVKEIGNAAARRQDYSGIEQTDINMYDDEITKKLKSAYSFSNCRGNCKYKSHTVSSEQLVKYKGETYFLCRVSIDTLDKSGKDYWSDSCELLVKAK